MSYEQDEQEQEPHTTTSAHHHRDSGISDWFEDSISFLAADADLAGYDWWTSSTTQHAADGVAAQPLIPAPEPPAAALSPAPVSASIASSPVSPSPPMSKKRKSTAHKAFGGHSQRRRAAGAEQEKGSEACRKPGAGGKKGGGRGGGGSCDRDARWAEQLLNPCAAAVEAGNLSRVQHMFYVLGELASFSGDANHRLAAHGLRALELRLPAAIGPAAAAAVRVPPCECPAPAFAGAEPRLFRSALIRFHEVSPWFALPNSLANAAILQAAAGDAAAPRPLHVVDLGVSHGVQWPTLLEALTRLTGGRTPPPVHLTIAGGAATPPVPFSASPPGYDFSPHLLRYAKSINLSLAIDRAPSLDAVRGFTAAGEALVVCLQFRLGHVGADERTDILRKVRSLGPELVVLSELDSGGDGRAVGEFAARLELMWRFLESTAAAFKGREGEERRVMEAEAGRAVAMETAGEGRERWRERMAAAGFQEAAFGDEAVEAAKALLRKYDSGWEMAAPPSAGGTVGLRWKGQPVSFCSLWRPA